MKLYRLSLVTCLVVSVACSSDEIEGGENAKLPSYSEDDFHEKLPDQDHFIMFYAPWCGHCQRLKPVWEELFDVIEKDANNDIIIAKVDCTVETKLCSDEGVLGYPTLKLYPLEGDSVRHQGARDLKSLRSFIEDTLNPGEEEEADGISHSDGLYQLTAESFKNHIADGKHFIKFYAPWCGHCKRLEPVWLELAMSHIPTEDDADDVKIARVDCTEHRDICSKYEVRGYPTLLWFEDGEMVKKYQSGRDIESLEKFIRDMIPPPQSEEEEDDEDPPVDEEGLYDLTESNFKTHTSKGFHFIKFYAPWCGHCMRMEPVWKDLAKSHRPSDENPSEVKIGRVDCTKNQKVCSEQDVKGYPTLLWFEDGKMMKLYQGARQLKDFETFIAKMTGAEQEEEEEEEEEEKEVKKEVKPSPSPVFDDKEDAEEGPVLQLDDDNFDFNIAVDVTFVMFYAPWCGFCKRLTPTWEELAAEDFSEMSEEVSIAKVDCTKNKDLCQKFEVRGYPTLLLFKDGEQWDKYSGDRSKDNLKNFVIQSSAKKPVEEEKKDEL